MASEGSVAPKERVNIVYSSDTGGAQEQVELPLKQLVIGDFTLREDDTPVEDLKPIRVDKDNFTDSLKALKGPMGNLPEFRKQLQALMNDDGARERLLSELGVKDKE